MKTFKQEKGKSVATLSVGGVRLCIHEKSDPALIGMMHKAVSDPTVVAHKLDKAD